MKNSNLEMTTKIKRMIAQCESIENLNEIAKAAQAQTAELRKRAAEEIAHAKEQAWEDVRKSKPKQVAMTLKGGSASILVGEGSGTTHPRQISMAAGEVLRVHAVQPRAKRLWLKNDSGNAVYLMTPDLLAKLVVRVYPDELTANIALVQYKKMNGG